MKNWKRSLWYDQSIGQRAEVRIEETEPRLFQRGGTTPGSAFITRLQDANLASRAFVAVGVAESDKHHAMPSGDVAIEGVLVQLADPKQP